MSTVLVFVVLTVIGLFIVTEVAAAVVPMVLVITLVHPADRQALAEVLAAADSSRRLRLWPAMRLAVAARRHSRRAACDARTR